MTTIQGPQRRTTTQGPPHWYPIPLLLRYKATSKHGMVLGFGQTRMMNSQDIIFATGDELKPGMEAQIALAPFLLDGRIPLQIVLDATITDSQDGVAEARILAYHFRTRRAAEAERRAEPTGVEAPAVLNPPVALQAARKRSTTAQVNIAT